jgi:putative DNA methylase
MAKKLIEVALPLDAINAACKVDKDRKVGHIRNLHKWFAPMPLPAWRAALFASLVDDPGEHLPQAEAESERYRLFNLIERLVPWEAQHDQGLLSEVRAEITRSITGEFPTIVDPFCGGGSTLVEAQRLGLPTFGSDLNPVPVLITAVLTVGVARFSGRPPVHADGNASSAHWDGPEGLIADIQHYGGLIQARAWEEIGHHFPPAADGGTVIAWRWTHTVPSPDPRFRDVQTPIPGDWRMSWNKKGRIAVVPVVDKARGTVRFMIDSDGGDTAPTMGKSGGQCLFSGAPLKTAYVQESGKKNELGHQMLGIIALVGKERTYHAGTPSDEAAAAVPLPDWLPDVELPDDSRNIWCKNYGLTRQVDLYLPRQLRAIETFGRLVAEIHGEVQLAAADAALPGDCGGLEDGGQGPRAYADAVCAALGLAVSRLAQTNSKLVRWNVRESTAKAEPAFDKQTMPFMWDFVETNPFGDSVGSWRTILKSMLPALRVPRSLGTAAAVEQLDARHVGSVIDANSLVATDPPYFDNISYADLSDYFYVWQRRTLREFFPRLYATIAVPKAAELAVAPSRHRGNLEEGERFCREGLTTAFRDLATAVRSDLPMLVVYAYKQEESKQGVLASTGWDVMLDGLLAGGLRIVGTWPIRTTRQARTVGIGTNALASAILLVCRRREKDAPLATRREFVQELRTSLPPALDYLTKTSIAPVDLNQAAIGPGMAVFSIFQRVLESDGSSMSVRTALHLINQELNEFLSGLAGEFDATTQFCTNWFAQRGFASGPYGEAELMATSKAVSVRGLEEDGVLFSAKSSVRLRESKEYPASWDPRSDQRVSVWECTHQLVRALNEEGEVGAAELVRAMGSGRAEDARSLAYRLYQICNEKNLAEPALGYNALAASWTDIIHRAAELQPGQTSLDI